MMAAAAAFSTRPWYGGPYVHTEAAIHGVLAGTMGVVFAVGVIAAALHARHAGLTRRLVLDVAAVAATVVVAVGMSTAPSAQGAFQQVIFAVAYAWYAAAAAGILRSLSPHSDHPAGHDEPLSLAPESPAHSACDSAGSAQDLADSAHRISGTTAVLIAHRK